MLRTPDPGSSSWPGPPTPTARDWKGHGYPGQLPNAVALLPTPRTSDTNGPGTHGDGGPDLRTVVSLLPTPWATDGTKGGPNQRGSAGDLMLSSAVSRLLPTPTATNAHGNDRNNHGRLLLPGVAKTLTPSTGATTGPRSTDGPASSDAPHPRQLSLDDTADPD
ncbi:hypothetical protein [Actinomadura rudentiformis]|uniref:hypothetical protein n=1 Tax=Actinomadura rudentiformis TaxID=359158 RepID=UPI001CEF9645|nr:hypothetical protein [Actinomadura rudentiformis]